LVFNQCRVCALNRLKEQNSLQSIQTSANNLEDEKYEDWILYENIKRHLASPSHCQAARSYNLLNISEAALTYLEELSSTKKIEFRRIFSVQNHTIYYPKQPSLECCK